MDMGERPLFARQVAKSGIGERRFIIIYPAIENFPVLIQGDDLPGIENAEPHKCFLLWNGFVDFFIGKASIFLKRQNVRAA